MPLPGLGTLCWWALDLGTEVQVAFLGRAGEGKQARKKGLRQEISN